MRLIIFAFCLLFSSLSFGQAGAVSIFKGTAAGGATDSLLNLYGDSIGFAVSVFQLDINVDTFGTAVCSADNSTIDVLFSGGVYDTASVKTSCGSGHAYLKRAFDQGGNSFHFTQTDTSLMPTIMQNGNIIRNGAGNLAIRFQENESLSTGTGLSITSTPVNRYFYFCEKQDEADIFRDNALKNRIYSATSDYVLRNNISFRSTGAQFSNGARNLIEYRFQNLDCDLLINGTLDDTNSSIEKVNITNGTLGYINRVIDLYLSEIIFWDGAKDTDAASIRTNINNRFSIY